MCSGEVLFHLLHCIVPLLASPLPLSIQSLLWLLVYPSHPFLCPVAGGRAAASIAFGSADSAKIRETTHKTFLLIPFGLGLLIDDGRLEVFVVETNQDIFADGAFAVLTVAVTL